MINTAPLVFIALMIIVLIVALRLNSRQQGSPGRTSFSSGQGVPAARPPTFVRSYRGSTQAQAISHFNDDSEVLAKAGYVPTAQSWAPGQWSGADFLGALLLCLLLIGILVFIYMIIVKPAGTLTVTYGIDKPAADPKPDALHALQELGKLRDSGVITTEEFEAKKADLLSRI